MWLKNVAIYTLFRYILVKVGGRLSGRPISLVSQSWLVKLPTLFYLCCFSLATLNPSKWYFFLSTSISALLLYSIFFTNFQNSIVVFLSLVHSLPIRCPIISAICIPTFSVEIAKKGTLIILSNVFPTRLKWKKLLTLF